MANLPIITRAHAQTICDSRLF